MGPRRRNRHVILRSANKSIQRIHEVIETLEPRTLLAAAPPTVLRDPTGAGLFAEAGGKAFFVEYGSTLNVTNGTSGGTFSLGPVGQFGNVTAMKAVGDEVYLTTGSGVWRSDGTAAGTVQVLPMSGNIGGVAKVNGYVEMGGYVYFYAEVRDGGTGLWKTDGTVAGTSLVTSFFADPLLAVGDTLYFIGDDQSTGKELWKTDGTVAGTRVVKDINPTNGSLIYPNTGDLIAEASGRVVFAAYDGTTPYPNIWSSDGTEAGTLKISGSQGGGFIRLGDFAYYSAVNAAGKGELWRTDGTAAGTTRVKATGSSLTSRLYRAGDTLYFFTQANGLSTLWKSDGTPEGTGPIAGPATGQRFESTFNFTDVAGTAVFTASEHTTPSSLVYALWTSDGTTAGTVKVRDTFTRDAQGAFGFIGAAGSVALFTANDGVGSPELWALQTAIPPPSPEARTQTPTPYAIAEGGTALPLHGYLSVNPLPDRPLTYDWDLDGDGVFGETGAAAARGDETGTDPTFNAAGLDGPSTYVARFRISDPTGDVNVADADIAILNAPPTLNVTGGPAVLTQGMPYTLHLSAADFGPDTISKWIVDWGDGVVQTLPGNTTSAVHDFPNTPAAYGVTVTASDEDGRYQAKSQTMIDPTFSIDGGAGLGIAYPTGVAVQPDGKILTAGGGVSVTRLNPDGTPDLTFGVSGQTRLSPADKTHVGSIALQPDGRILVAAANHLIRLLPDGSLDPTFGGFAGDPPGWAAYDFNDYDGIYRLGVLPDGRIVGGGTVDQHLALARFTPDGALDSTFGTNGKAISDFPVVGGPGAQEMAIQPDGKILVVPSSDQRFSSGLTLLRFNADGSPDPKFGDGGRASVDPNRRLSGAVASSVALTPDGSILLAGLSFGLLSSAENNLNEPIVVRFTPDGALDSTFADNGILRVTPSAAFRINDIHQILSLPVVRMLRDGRFVLAGSQNPYGSRILHFINQYEANGAPDIGFSPDGRFELDYGEDNHIGLLRDLALQPDGAPLAFRGNGSILRLTPGELSVQVVDAGQPQLSVIAPATVPEGSTFSLGLTATDDDGIAQSVVDWGDGAVEVFAGTPPVANHVFPDGREFYNIKVSVIDRDRSIAVWTSSIEVLDVPPTIAIMGDPMADEGTPYAIHFTSVDPGVDAILDWEIDWGDGTVEPIPGDVAAAHHAYSDQGTYPIVVSGRNDDGIFAAAPFSVVVQNVAPTLDPLADRVAAAGANFNLFVAGRDVVAEIFSGVVDWGDGSAPTSFALPGDQPMTSHDFTMGHLYAARGDYVATVDLSDGDGGAARRTVKVHVGDVVVHVFNDINGDGVFNIGEVQRVDVQAYLDLDRDGAYDPGESAQFTDAYGDALFDRVSGAGLQARIIAPSSWHLSKPAAGYLEVAPGSASALATFGLTQIATASGALFDDANANGVRDEGEGPLAAQVRARRIDSDPAAFLTAAADANGVYRFAKLVPGQYLIDLVSPSRAITAPYGRAGRLVTVTGDQAEYAVPDLGSAAGVGSSVRGTVYQDHNGNGVRDNGDGGIYGRIVYVDANDNGVFEPDEFNSGLSFSSGGWVISSVPPGTFHLRQVVPAGWRQTDPTGDSGAKDFTFSVPQVPSAILFGSKQLPSTVVGRQVFYARSAFDGIGIDTHAAAIATDKSALLSGQAASFENITSYSRGMTGIMVDIANLPQETSISLADFEFRVGRDGDPTLWPLVASPPTMNGQRGAGAGGSDRLIFTWDDGVIRDTWLRVTVRASAATGLAKPDVFYFGNLAGETGDSTIAASVNAADLVRVRNAVGQKAAVDNRFDFNRDGVVNAADLVIVRNNVGHTLPTLATPGGSLVASATVGRGAVRTAPPARLVITSLFSDRSITMNYAETDELDALSSK